MTAQFIAFFILSICAIGGAVFMINLNKVMHMAISLAFTFFSIAGVYFLLDAEFLAVVQILIYTGAISILMIFGIMLTKHREEEKKAKPFSTEFSSLGLVVVLFGIIIAVVYQLPITAGTNMEMEGENVAKLGELVFTKYVIPFELTSVLLLVALVGAILLAKKSNGFQKQDKDL